MPQQLVSYLTVFGLVLDGSQLSVGSQQYYYIASLQVLYYFLPTSIYVSRKFGLLPGPPKEEQCNYGEAYSCIYVGIF